MGKHKLGPIGSIYWAIVPHAVVWSIWGERNRRVFEDKDKVNSQLVTEIKSWIWEWSCESELTKKIRREDLVFDWTKTIWNDS
ncbi:hypothetical protein ACHQM5_000567 [Ranunculus cassubicifolius]